MTTFSVVLPAFNRLHFLRDAVASVRAQTLDDWELLIADDGSDAETRGWLAALTGDPRIRVLLLEHRGSPAVSRNEAIRRARGKYLAFLDSDDVWMPDKLARQLAALRARPECRWSYTAFTRVDAQGRVLAGEAQRRWTPHEGWIFDAVLRSAATIRTTGVVVERALIDEVGAFDPDIRACEDIDLWLRLSLVSPIALVDVPLFEARIAPGSYSDRWAHALEDRGRALNKMMGVGTARSRGAVAAEYARNAAALSVEYLLVGRGADAWRESRNWLRYGWRRPASWRDGLRLFVYACRQPARREAR